MTVGAAFTAWHTVPPSVRILVFTSTVPPSIWTSPVVAQLSGAFVPTGDAVPLYATTSHMWWRVLHTLNRWSAFDLAS